MDLDPAALPETLTQALMDVLRQPEPPLRVLELRCVVRPSHSVLSEALALLGATLHEVTVWWHVHASDGTCSERRARVTCALPSPYVTSGMLRIARATLEEDLGVSLSP